MTIYVLPRLIDTSIYGFIEISTHMPGYVCTTINIIIYNYIYICIFTIARDFLVIDG